MAKPRTNYTRDFKMSILSQIESGLSIAQVARENGLHT
jgi:transposase-like protein